MSLNHVHTTRNTSIFGSSSIDAFADAQMGRAICELPLQQRILAGIIAWIVFRTKRMRTSGTEIYEQYKLYMSRAAASSAPSLAAGYYNNPQRSMLRILKP